MTPFRTTTSAAWRLLLLLLLCAAAPSPASAQGRPDDKDLSLGFGFGSLRGDTLYHISSYDATGGIESELKFPLNTTIAGLAGGYQKRNKQGREQFRLDVQWLTNIGSVSGAFKDSDWITGAPETAPPPTGFGYPPHPGLDIYSESRVSLKATMLDARAAFSSWPADSWNIGPLFGMLYESFFYDASDATQVGFGPYAPTSTRSVAGRVLTYRVSYFIPYAGVRTGYAFGGGLSLGLDLAYSPTAWAEDRDDHLLRHKVARGETSGTAVLAALTGTWEIDARSLVRMSYHHLQVRTTGTQSQYWYAADGSVPAGTFISGIDDRIDTTQSSLLFVYNYRF